MTNNIELNIAAAYNSLCAAKQSGSDEQVRAAFETFTRLLSSLDEKIIAEFFTKHPVQ